MTSRRVIITALLALAEAAVLAPIVFILVPAPSGLTLTPQIGVIWVILFGFAMQWRWLAQRGVGLSVQRVLMGFWLIVLIVLAELDTFANTPNLQLDLLSMAPAFLTAIVLWWRGMSLGADELQPRSAELHLQAGMLLLIITSFATLFIRNDEVFIPIIAFFIGALGAVPLCNLEMTSNNTSGRPVPMTRGWWGWIALSVLGVLVIGLTLAALLTGRSAAEILALLIGVILLPIILILSIIPVTVLDALVEFLRRLSLGFGQLAQFGQGLQQLPQNENTAPPVVVPPEFNLVFALIVLAGVALFVLWLMQRADKPLFAKQVTSGDIEGNLPVEKEETAGAISRALGLSALRRWLAQMTIRRLYVRAVNEAGKRGQKRTPSQTPYDFLPAMQRAFPEHAGEAREITEAYIAAHYGQVPDSDEALNALKQAWKRMRQSAKE
jgi:hypothetical protein